jgi:hypothetical protein
MGKQGELKGIERPKIQEIEDAAEVYVKSRNKRMKLSKEEKADKTALIEMMKKHKQSIYKLDDGEIVTISSTPQVKVSRPEEPEDDEAEDEKEAKAQAN